jgi:hypothetical protein
MSWCLVGSEMCIRDSHSDAYQALVSLRLEAADVVGTIYEV